jgi:hypothetical protein
MCYQVILRHPFGQAVCTETIKASRVLASERKNGFGMPKVLVGMICTYCTHLAGLVLLITKRELASLAVWSSRTSTVPLPIHTNREPIYLPSMTLLKVSTTLSIQRLGRAPESRLYYLHNVENFNCFALESKFGRATLPSFQTLHLHQHWHFSQQGRAHLQDLSFIRVSQHCQSHK